MIHKPDIRRKPHPAPPDAAASGGDHLSDSALLDRIDQLQDFYDFSPVGYLTVDSAGRILEGNLTAATMLRLVRSEMVDQSLYDHIHWNDRDTLYLHLRNLFRSGRPQTCELRMLHADEKIVHVRLESIFSEDRKGRIHCKTVLIDITGRVLSEQTLLKTDENLRLALEGGRLGTWSRDLRTGETSWNDHLQEMLGRDLKGPDVTDETFFKYIHPEDLERVRRLSTRSVQRGDDFSEEFRVIREDGEIRWFATAGRLFRDSEGRRIRIAGVNLDITDRKRAEEEVRRKEALYRSFIELTGQLAWTTNAFGEVVETPALFCAFTGLSEEEVMGRGWLKALHPDDVEYAERAWRESVAVKSKYEVEYRVRRYDGVYRHFLARGVPLLEDDGSVREWVGTCMDISERKAMEDLLKRSNEELETRVWERTAALNKKTLLLEHANKVLQEEIEKRKAFESALKAQGETLIIAYNQRDFLSRKLVSLLERERREIGNALHEEIGQIMTGVMLQMERLKTVRQEDEGGLAEQVTAIQDLLRGAVMQSRNISRNLRLETLERGGLVSAIKDLIRDIERESRVRVRLFVKNIPDDSGEAEKELTIYRVVQESLTNALKYAEADKVFINLIGKDSGLSLTIEDNGVGFDYAAVSKKADEKGGSLGLTIMRERVSQVGGRFHIETAPGRGTQILVEVPAG